MVKCVCHPATQHDAQKEETCLVWTVVGLPVESQFVIFNWCKQERKL